MGTWDDGLLDNDTAMDTLGDLGSGVAEDVLELGQKKPGSETTAQLAAAVGVLLQLSSYPFDTETDTGPRIMKALRHHGEEIAKLPPGAREALEAVAEGRGVELADRPGEMTPELAGLLRKGSEEAPFGKRVPELFGPSAAAYVQKVADRCVELVREDFEDEDTWSDLCREGMGMGALAALLVLEPCKVSVDELGEWRRMAQEGLARLVEEDDEELSFHRGYYANLDAVFAALEKRFA